MPGWKRRLVALFTDPLRKNAALLQAMLENIDQGVIVADADGTVQVCNRRAMQLLDLPESLMASQPHVDVVVDFVARRGELRDVPDDIRALALPKLFGDSAHTFERTRPDGTVIEVRSAPLAAGGGVRIYTDVTARRRAEQNLKDSESQFRLLAENATDVIVRIGLDGKVLYISPSCRTVLGRSPEEMIGTWVHGYIHPDDAEPVLQRFRDAIKAGVLPRQTIEYRVRHGDGHWLWVATNPTLVVDGEGRPTEIVDVIRDVSARKALEVEAKAAREQAEKAAAAQARFLAAMSHELRTPLNSIDGFTDLLLHRHDLSAEARRQVELVQTASMSLLMVVDDILDFTRLDEGKLEMKPDSFQLAGLVEDSIAIVRGLAARRKLDVGVSVDAAIPPYLVGDAGRLRQVLLNLLNNAIKFTEAGHVALTVEQAAASDAGVTVRFAVADTGIGIAADKLHLLFRRFSQIDSSARREFGGSGLGLVICKRLVEMMGGKIGVESTPHLGSTFWFTVTLPIAAAPPEEPVEEVAPRAIRPATVLVAEDVELNQEIVRSILESAGHTVDVVHEGADAVMAAAARDYDVVLMDIQMPGMDGLEATARIRALPGAAGRVPIIAMTANVLPEQVESYRAAGLDGHVGKPFKRPDLLATIARCVESAPAAAPPAGPAVVAAPERTDPGVLDAETFDSLVATLGANKVRVLLAKLAEQLGGVFDELPTTRADRTELARAAHRLVSSCGMLGFLTLSATCSRLERALLGDEDVTPILAETRAACRAAVAEITARLTVTARAEQA